MMIYVASNMPIYEIGGKEIAGSLTENRLAVLSHWNRPNLVVIEVDGKKYTVAAADLLAAVANAQNTARHG